MKKSAVEVPTAILCTSNVCHVIFEENFASKNQKYSALIFSH